MEPRQLFDFSVNNKYDYIWKNQRPGRFKGLVLPRGCTSCIIGPFGDMVFQYTIKKLYSVWLSQYRIKRPVITHARLDRPFIELSLMLEGRGKYDLNPFGPAGRKGWQFNLMYCTELDSKVKFERGMQMVTIDIHLEIELLEMLYMDFPRLAGPLLEAIHAGRPVQYCREPLYATPEMAATVFRLQRQLSSLQASEALQDYLVTLLVIQALQINADDRYLPMRYDQALVLHRILDEGIRLALSDLGEYKGNDYYARQCAMSGTTFKKYMHLVKRDTLKNIWQNARLDASLEKVLYTDKFLVDIAREFAFAHMSGFRNAFKKKYGMFPGRIRALSGI